MASLQFPSRCRLLQTVIKAIERIAPPELADKSWDNTGLILESVRPDPASPHFRLMTTVDLTEQVALEAVENGVDMIIAYHPPWFKAIKQLTMERGREARVLAYLASKGVSVYSPHTALDNVRPGINDHVLGRLFGSDDSKNSSAITFNEKDSSFGSGRLMTLPAPITVEEALKAVSSHYSLPTMRYALGASHTLQTPIKTVAVCVGSGASVFSKLSEPADLLLTGEMSHHELLKASNEAGSSVILTEHSTMERAYVNGPFVELLLESIKSLDWPAECELSFYHTKLDHDPVLFYSPPHHLAVTHSDEASWLRRSLQKE